MEPQRRNNNRIFSMSLLARIDPETMKMDMADGNFVVIDSREVAKCIGLNPSGKKIDIRAGACLPDREELLGKFHAILETGMPKTCKIPIVRVKKIVQNTSKVAIVGAERERENDGCMHNPRRIHISCY